MTTASGRTCDVVSASVAPGHLPLLREWLVAEWGTNDSLDNQPRSETVPPPLLAIDGPELLGGLVFTRFRAPRSGAPGLWVDAVLVAPEHRRKRIASRLIRAAETEAIRLGESELFALTDIPDLYRKLGWKPVERGSDGTIMRAALIEA